MSKAAKVTILAAAAGAVMTVFGGIVMTIVVIVRTLYGL